MYFEALITNEKLNSKIEKRINLINESGIDELVELMDEVYLLNSGDILLSSGRWGLI